MTVQEIRSRNNQWIKQVKQARLGKGLWQEALLIEGKTLVEEALRSGLSPLALFSDEVADLTEVPETFEAPVYVLPVSLFEEISATVSPQGLLLVAEEPARPDLFERTWQTILYLEEIQDPGNLGTILRSAEAFGTDLVALGQGSVNPRNEKVLRAAMGAAFRVPIVRGITIDELGRLADEKDMRIAAADMSKREAGPYLAACRDTPLILILGNEARGLSQASRSLADDLISIPMAEVSESLNAAVAASILLYERSKIS